MIMRISLAIWLFLWARIGLPWRSFQWTPSFQRVELIPFQFGSPRTYVLNLLAFVPLGIISTRLGWHPRTVILVAAGVSVLTELLQLFSRGRYPSITDVILNTSGALLGVAVVIAVRNVLRQRSTASRAAP
jgi:glycopeptide antibiotics resistance protein